MNIDDVLKYGNLTLLNSLNNVPMSEWETPDVCGVWSVKNIVAHLASYELLLSEILMSFIDAEVDKPLFEAYGAGNFNDGQVDQRTNMTAEQVFQEYKDAYDAAVYCWIAFQERLVARQGRSPGTGKNTHLMT